ncbi:MAG TPA: hypothetical protein VEU33_37655 [Archangium sp.]|nr:hypothetical protein [Archangium sp.]
MKTVSVHTSKPEDSLWLEFEGTFDDRVTRQSELEPFLQTLEEYAGGWMPDVVEGKRQRKYSRDAIWKALEEEHDDIITTIGLYRTQWPALDLSLSLWFRPSLLKFFGHVKPLSIFTEAERCQHFVEMVRAWACRYPVSYASAHSSDDGELAGAPNFSRDDETLYRDGFDKLYAVWWLNVFGPKLVETVGRERMLSTPAHRVEELPNGSILLVTWPTAADFASDAARLAQARALVHLRPDLEFDTVLTSLRERSAALAPVASHFHPEAAPLFTRIVEHVSSHERPRLTAALNAWQPPESRQWLPASAALPSNLDDTERVRERYSLLAEHLVAMLHTQVPSVFQATPESLTDIDFLFWREDVPGTRLRENLDRHILPAVGAYLGQVLVHHLDGRWIARDKLLENQVLVGDRVWLPFLRAGYYLRSRQSLLDYSLTQLYREAERHLSPECAEGGP